MLSETAQQLIAAAQYKIVDKSNPLLDSLPIEQFRPHQVTAIEQIVEAYDHVDVVVVDAPTGSGKSIIGETVRRMVQVRGIYACHTISLQEQFAQSVGGAVLKGRRNYRPELAVDDSVSCDDCTKEAGVENSCGLCTTIATCPYELAKTAAVASSLSVLNTQYLLTEANTAGRFRGRGLVILDEADTLEAELMRYCQVSISPTRVLDLKLRVPKVTVESDWIPWINESLPIILSKRRVVNGITASLAQKRLVRGLDRLLDSLKMLQTSINSGDSWVFTGRNGGIEFKPVEVTEVGRKYLWPLGRKFLLMSATVISSDELVRGLGWDGEYATVRVPHTFPKEQRRVRVRPCGSQSKKDAQRDSLIRGIEGIIRTSKGRSLIHTVSYDLAVYIESQLATGGRPVFTYRRSSEKDAVLQEAARHGSSIIIAPSLDRGIDLPDDLCRTVIIAKVPYPNLGDRQVSARLYSKGGRLWYDVQTVRSIVQMAGRGVRHENDWCDTYILDAQFSKLYSKSKRLFPGWFREALIWER